jgi:hypothetical protein
MKGRLILPNTFVPEGNAPDALKGPVIYLAGPIRSAPPWQDDAIHLLLALDPDVMIASPRKEIEAGLARYVATGDEVLFSRQRAWERHYMDKASKTGALLFWLPGEARHDCNKVYGAMTRLELGQWMTNYRHDHAVRFLVGSDGKFPELDTIMYDLMIDAPEKGIIRELDTLCEAAVTLARTSMK